VLNSVVNGIPKSINFIAWNDHRLQVMSRKSSKTVAAYAVDLHLIARDTGSVGVNMYTVKIALVTLRNDARVPLVLLGDGA